MDRWTRNIILVAAARAGAVLAIVHAGASFGNDVCDQTGDAVFRACQSTARADYLLALARCRNLSTEVSACRKQAVADSRDASDTCREQDEARDTICTRLGGAAYDPVINPANFVATVDNPYFPLTPGTTFIYEGQTTEGFNHSEFFVTHNTKVILGVTCTEVHDIVYLDGKLAEDTLDWFAQDTAGNVWYFGENTGELIDGRFVTLDGTFTAGVNGAKAGIIMKAQPAIGDFYRQEFDLANAEDLAEVISLTETVSVPAKPTPYTNCLQTAETTPLETDLLEYKYYAAGVGNVLTVDAHTGDRLELIQVIP